MALLKLEDFDPNYRETFAGDDIKGIGVYTETDEKIGTVSDVLVDESGHFRYLVVDLGFWIFGKKVLLPIGRSRIDYNADRVYAIGMTRDQADHLPEYSTLKPIDYDYEEQVRGIYRSPSVEDSAPAEMSIPVDSTPTGSSLGNMFVLPNQGVYDRNSYNYGQEPSLYGMNEQDHQTFKLYEERLIANKTRAKTGEVVVGKHVETDKAQVSVPVEKERVVIERTNPDFTHPVDPNNVDFHEGEVARVEVYEETPDIRKEAFVREQVNIRKEVNRDTVETEDTIRREELDINRENNVR